MEEPVEKREPGFSSFAEEVWVTLNAIDVSPYIEQKKITANLKLDYLSWAAAWRLVMDPFPESDFEFDEPKIFPNGTGEQWITVNIRRGDDVLTRRWWLPYLSSGNQPVADPNSLQINNTRMRVLVKCLAMCGLGTELYAGEDVPDESHDQKPVHGGGNSARKAALAGTEIDEVAVDGYVVAVNAVLPETLAEVAESGTVKKIHFDQIEDWAPITDLSLSIATHGDMAIAVADRLTSWRRSIMRKAMERHRSRLADEHSAAQE